MTLPRNVSLQKLSSLRQEGGRRNPGAAHRKQTKPHFCDNVTERKVKVTIRASQPSPKACLIRYRQCEMGLSSLKGFC